MKQISLRNYYLFAIWLPFIVPSVIIGLDNIFLHSEIVNLLGGFLFSPLIFGGVQYLGFALWATYHYRKSSVEELKKFSLKAPLYFIPLCILGILIFYITIGWITTFRYYSTENSAGSYLGISFFISLVVILYGYFYVALAHSLGFLLKKFNLIKE